ncbi:MAG: RES domain-containing protein, partial [Jatrophihabitantaceae bacterium]
MRPPGLRLSALHRPWYRLDSQAPGSWSWQGGSVPRSRFDSASGVGRVRYAGDAQRVAMRERFDSSGRIVSADDLGLHLVELTGRLQVLDLRRDRI